MSDKKILPTPLRGFLHTSALFVFAIFTVLSVNAQSTARDGMDPYFQKIRNNEAALTAFFAAMPKGGDLHNHFTGSIYAEWYLDFAIQKKYWINLDNLKITNKPDHLENYKRLDILCDDKKFDFASLQQRLFQEWSVKDYYEALAPSDMHFFDAFGKFPKMTWVDFNEGLKELKKRAKKENVQYLEVMLSTIPVKDTGEAYADRLRQLVNTPQMLTPLLDSLYSQYDTAAANRARVVVDSIKKVAHKDIDDNDFAMRYIAFVKREAPPVEVFQAMLGAFKAVMVDTLMVGVNIVSREDGRLSMKDYSLHMQFFKYLHKKFPKVKYSLHAGELTIGLVRPEDLTFHISEAVLTAEANRIGHGVDLAYETNSDQLLKYMQQNKVAIEINLTSNQFILKVKDDKHPVLLYHRHHVPIVISTDDAGILRSSLTEQFVLLAKRYPELKYSDIRSFVQNSITYSFIKESKLKQELTDKLNKQLNAFEESFLPRK